MAEGIGREGWLQFGVAAELHKKYAADQRDFIELLALMLEGALPEETEIERRGGLFSKKHVAQIRVTLGEDRYLLEKPERGGVQASHTRVVRGIALKTEPMPVDEWVSTLGAALEERAKTSAAAREALQRIVAVN